MIKRLMTPKEMDDLTNTMTDHFKELGWSDHDTYLGINWIAQVILTCIIHEIPLTHAKFPEVLRGLANALEIVAEKTSK